jgi:hypothetical protein
MCVCAPYCANGQVHPRPEPLFVTGAAGNYHSPLVICDVISGLAVASFALGFEKISGKKMMLEH